MNRKAQVFLARLVLCSFFESMFYVVGRATNHSVLISLLAFPIALVAAVALVVFLWGILKLAFLAAG